MLRFHSYHYLSKVTAQLVAEVEIQNENFVPPTPAPPASIYFPAACTHARFHASDLAAKSSSQERLVLGRPGAPVPSSSPWRRVTLCARAGKPDL